MGFLFNSSFEELFFGVSFKSGVFAVTFVRFSFRLLYEGRILLAFALFMFSSAQIVQAGSVKATVRVIIDKLPAEKEERMANFDRVIENYIENVEWLEEDDQMPIEISLQLLLNESLSNIEDRYNCEFLISASDVQYFDRRVRFPYQPGDALVYNEQSVDPLTAVINFYVNMVLGSELDKARGYGGEIYYKRAANFASLGKFVRTEFVRGWPEREELIKRVFKEPFLTFRKMKDYYFYSTYLLNQENDKNAARENMIAAIRLLEDVMNKQSDMEEPKQFLNAHYLEIVELFKDYSHRNEVFQKLMQLDPDHKQAYEEHITGS